MHELTLTYDPGERELGALLEEWELRLYDGNMPTGEIAEQRRALREIWQLRARMRDWIAPLNRVGIGLDVNRAWLPCSDQAEAAAVDDRIDRVLRSLVGSASRSALRSTCSISRSRSASASAVRTCSAGSRSSPRSS